MRHVYIHIPFCRRRCSYCDFSIAVRKHLQPESFIGAIRNEHELRLKQGAWDDEALETLYLGGGTPSLLPAEHVADLVQYFLRRRLVDQERARTAEYGGRTKTDGVEVTLEANPDDVSVNTIKTWVDSGVNRVSLGIQSFDRRVLDWMHRTHSVEQSLAAYANLRDSGVASISLDLIFALPPELNHVFGDDLDRALELEPDHLSVYGLTVEPRTPYGRWISRGAASPTPEGCYTEEFLAAHETLTAAGYDPYEISNYARPGHQAVHNRAYWTGRSYAGLGPSAHRFDGDTRSWNVSPWAEYQRLVGTREDPTEERETLTDEQKRLERIYLALRTSDGVSAEDSRHLNREVVRRALEQGWVEPAESSESEIADRQSEVQLASSGGFRLTPEGWLRIDQLTPGLTTSARGG
jgi:oxygen-independent coproporphyrinogen-3 oxidase